MKFVTLTNECSSFSWTETDDNLHLSWDISVEMAHVAHVGLKALTIYPIVDQDNDCTIPIRCNLIARTIGNPFRQIDNGYVQHNSNVLHLVNTTPGIFNKTRFQNIPVKFYCLTNPT